MSGSTRSIVFALVGTGIITAGIAFGLVEQEDYSDRAYKQATEYAKVSARKVADTCLVRPSEDRAKCYREGANKYRLDSRDKQREYEELVAQQKSALWSMIMGIAALIGMALSAVGIALVWLTFHEQRKTNRLAREEADRAKAETNAIAQSFLSAQRPRIFAVNLREVDYLDQVYVLKVANAGQSPAIIEDVAFMVFIDNVRRNSSGGKKFGYVTLSGGAEMEIDQPDIEVTDDPRVGGSTTIRGIVQYSDVHSVRREHGFSFLVAPNKTGYIEIHPDPRRVLWYDKEIV